MQKLQQIIGWIVLNILATATSMIMYGWLLSTLWGWFAVPTFHIARLTIPIAMGLSIMVRCITYQALNIESPKNLSGEEIVSRWLGRSIFVPLAIYAIAYVIHLFA